MPAQIHDEVSTLDLHRPIWERFYTVAPLVLVGTREEDGRHNFAPKHMAIPLGWDNYFGFVCSPRHRTYQNIVRTAEFTVSYPRSSEVVLASLAAEPRHVDDIKPALQALPTLAASQIDGVFFKNSYLFLECRLITMMDGFGENSLVAGRIVAAHVHHDALRLLERDNSQISHKNPFLAYLHPGRFALIEETYSFPFPAGFAK